MQQQSISSLLVGLVEELLWEPGGRCQTTSFSRARKEVQKLLLEPLLKQPDLGLDDPSGHGSHFERHPDGIG